MKAKLNWKAASAAAALLVGASWIGNLLYWNSMQLRKTYVFEQNVRINSEVSQMLNVNFIEDNYASSKVGAIQLEGHPQIRFDLMKNNENVYQQQMRAWTEINPQEPWFKELKSGPLNLLLFYDDGRTEKVTLGTLEMMSGENQLLEMRQSGGGGGGQQMYADTLARDAVLENVDVSPPQLKSSLELTVDGKTLDETKLPHGYQKGETIRLQWSDSLGQGIDPRVMDLAELKLSFRLPDGQAVVERLPLYSYETLSNQQLAELVRKERGETK
ncbi:hypothetical protein M3223_02760 [Paenibacillus pasadenensis]|uniref:hypothetical protein n=1 Tax=Paenibacillus pasadenensis TaxID=217090 RepID=UPI00203AB760|nr:hypothetical protein [Paenibacillus pasadenensis]MCM3746267.1 hypothetical protein [Paenibacillus pasadenensis]